MEMPATDQTNSEPASPEGQGDLSQGYVIHLTVKPDGFQVSEAEPLASEESEGDTSDSQPTYPDLTTALKHIVAEVKSNPLGDDSHAQFAAGYSEGPGGAGQAEDGG